VREVRSQSDGGLERAQQAYGQAAEEMRREQEALAATGALMVELSEDNVALHRQTLQMLDAVRRELEQVKQQLKRMIVART
jgi:hypothetical protein